MVIDEGWRWNGRRGSRSENGEVERRQMVNRFEENKKLKKGRRRKRREERQDTRAREVKRLIVGKCVNEGNQQKEDVR